MAKSTLFLNSSIQNLIQSTTTTTNQSQQPYHQQQQKSLNSSFTILNNNDNNNSQIETENYTKQTNLTTLPIEDKNIFSKNIDNFFHYMKDLFLFSTLNDQNNHHHNDDDDDIVGIANNNDNDDEDFMEFFNTDSSGYHHNVESVEILSSENLTTTISNILNDLNFNENSNSTSINFNSTISSTKTTKTTTIMPTTTIIPHYPRNHLVDDDNHRSSSSSSSTMMTPIQKLFDMNRIIRTSNDNRSNLYSTTTNINVVNLDQNSHQNNNNLLHSQSSSIDNISLTPFLTSTTTTIASNLTEDYQRPIFFQTSSTTMTDIFVDNIQPDDTNNIFSFAPGGRQCFHSPEDYELITSMLCSSLLVLGVVYFTYGYRCFRAFSFFVGFILGAILFHTICTAENISIVPTLIPQHGNLIASLLAGLMIGLFTMLVAYLGLFIIGIHLGLMLAIGLLIVIYLLRSYYIPLQAPLSSLTLLVFFISLSLVGSLTTVYFSKGGTIMASSMYGSALTLLCIDYFLEDFKVIHWFLDQLSSNSNNFVGSSTTNDIINNNGYNIIGTNPTNDWYGLLSGIKRSQSLCPGSFIILLLWPIFTLIGIIIQCCCTARHYKYHNGYGMVDNTSNGRCTPSILNHSRESIRSLNHYHYPYPNVSAKLYHHSTNSVRSNNDRSIKNSINMNATNLDEQRLEQRHRKYRYLYQVRTAHGDVISQHYLQSLQNKKQNHQQQQQQQHQQQQQQQQLCLPDQDSFTFNSDQSSHFFPSESRTTTLSVA